jgi:hypothetical protein
VDLDAGELLIGRNLIVRGGQLLEKDTKTHAARRIVLFDDIVALLDEHRRRCPQRAQTCGATLTPDAYVFSFDPAGRQPMNPDSVTHRFGRLARATRQAVAEALRHLLPPRRLRSFPRVVKRKMSSFARKRDSHRHWPQPTKPPEEAVVLVTRTARGP